MFGNPSAERRAIESTYDAVCNIERVSYVKADHISRKNNIVIAENVPCGLSKNTDSSSQEEANRIIDSRVLFIAPEVDIRAGDSIIITLYGRTERLEAVGIPLLYATHQQVRLVRREIV